MNSQGKLTGWTAVLILAGIGLAIAGAALSPATLPACLLVGRCPTCTPRSAERPGNARSARTSAPRR